MFFSKEAKQAPDFMSEAKKILILPGDKANLDAFCAAAGIYKLLKSHGKDVTFIYPDAISEDFKTVISEDEITKLAQVRDLLINIDYAGTEIEKINYAVEGSKCKIILHPVSADFNTEKITYEKTGFDYDLVITVGAKSFTDYVSMYKEYEDDFSNTATINIDNSKKNQNFATVNVIDEEHETLSQLVLNKLVAWKYKVDSEVAKALLYGISKSNKQS